jgi:hypothetical protein
MILEMRFALMSDETIHISIMLVLKRQKNLRTGRFEFVPVKISAETVENPGDKKEHDIKSPFVRAMEARKFLGRRSAVERCERAGWFEPVKRGKRMTLYNRKDIGAAVYRIQWSEMP